MSKTCSYETSYRTKLKSKKINEDPNFGVKAETDLFEIEDNFWPGRDIPVVVHILDQTDPNNISDQQIDEQIFALNEDFNSLNADLNRVPALYRDRIGNPKISFHLIENGVIRKKIDLEIFEGQDYDNDLMKREGPNGSPPIDPEHILNIWVCQIDTRYFGNATPPWWDGDTQYTLDGIVIDQEAFGVGGTASRPTHLGRTATHEVGHYLGLQHIWGTSDGEEFPHNYEDDDGISDTPLQWGPTEIEVPQFPLNADATEPGGDMFMNYMDITPDDIMVMFTKDQVRWMRRMLLTYRPELGVVEEYSLVTIAAMRKVSGQALFMEASARPKMMRPATASSPGRPPRPLPPNRIIWPKRPKQAPPT